jgi:hypothetical protein
VSQPELSQDPAQVLAVAYGLVGNLMGFDVDEAEWFVRRITFLTFAQGKSGAEAGQIARREMVGRPWEQWPAEAPRF